MSAPLKLKAKDAEDLQVVSAVLQDAIAPVVDMQYREADKNFIMVVQRLCREGGSDCASMERVCCAFNLRGADAVQTAGFKPSETGQMLDLLAVMPEENELQLIFADDARIRIKLNNWNLIIEDFGERWPAQCEPCHEEKQA